MQSIINQSLQKRKWSKVIVWSAFSATSYVLALSSIGHPKCVARDLPWKRTSLTCCCRVIPMSLFKNA
jgi:hypothetical protein